MAVAGPWGRFTPARKLDLISQVYQPGDSSALMIATRLHQKFGIVVSRNAIIGTYGRQPELKKRFPFTGTQSSKGHRSARGVHSLALAEQKRISREAKEAMREEREERKRKAAEEHARMHDHRQKKAQRAAWEEANCKNVTLLDLEPHQCKWPTNDGGPFLFCAIEVQTGTNHSYCDYHRKFL